MEYRIALEKDLPEIVKLLANDALGRTREVIETPIPREYVEAFQQIANDKNQELIVLEDNNEIIGTMQLTFIQYLTYKGGIRTQIEAVRIREDKRNSGIGKSMIEWAINRAKTKKAHLLQLTTDKKRPRAIHFYKELGFLDSHEGMKIHFNQL